MVKILDCTLRDGGYVNNHSFSNKAGIIESLVQAGTDIVELGFLCTKKRLPIQTLYNSISEAEQGLYFLDSKSTVFAVMVDVEDIPRVIEESNNIKYIRLLFKKDNRNMLEENIIKFKDKGYSVILQPAQTSLYTDEEVMQVVRIANNEEVDGVYIVDTFGSMLPKDILRLLKLYNYLSEDIVIGLHSHNNLQQGLLNVYCMLECRNRDVFIDGTMQGVGRGGGNVPTEALMHFFNSFEDKYNLNRLIPILLTDVYGCKRTNLNDVGMFLTGIYNCHPNYLLNHKEVLKNVSQLLTYLTNLSGELRYNKEYAEEFSKQ